MKKPLSIVSALVVLSGEVRAQEAAASASTDNVTTLFYVVAGLVVVVSFLVAIVAIYMLQILKRLTHVAAAQEQESPHTQKATPSPTFWEQVNRLAGASVPIEQEEAILLDHEYDGIRELDNHLPPWWKALLYGSVVWGALYLFVYHVLDALPLSAEEYDNEVAYAELQQRQRQSEAPVAAIDANTVTMVTDAAGLQDGEKTFANVCASCHQADGGGDIGPNLTDAYWLHGGSINDIFKVVAKGVTGTNMIAWESSLSPEKIQNVSSYVLTLQGTSPSNPKSPEGDLYDAQGNTPEASPEGTESIPDTLDAAQREIDAQEGALPTSAAGAK